MARRNTGSKQLDTRITALDPAAVAVQVGNLTVANPQVIKPAGPNKALQQALDAMSAVGRLGQQIGQQREAKERDALEAARMSKADAEARRGDFTMMANEDSLAAAQMFSEDRLAEIDLQEGVEGPVQYQTLEDELLARIEDGREQGIAPEITLGIWTREQMDVSTGGLQGESLVVADDVYAKHYFPKVLKAASDWWNARVDQRHADTVDGISAGLASGDSLYKSPVDLQRDSSRDNNLNRMTRAEAVDVWVQSAKQAAVLGNFDQAIGLMEAVSEDDRTPAWFQEFDTVKDLQGQVWESGLTKALRDAAPLGEWIGEFIPQVRRVPAGPDGGFKTETYVPFQDADQVARLKSSLVRYAQDESVPYNQRAMRLQQMSSTVVGSAWDAVADARAALPTPAENQARVKAARDENMHNARIDAISALAGESIRYTSPGPDGHDVTLTLDATASDQQLLDFFRGKYGPDGVVFLDQFKQLRTAQRWSPDTDNGLVQDQRYAELRQQLEFARDGVDEEGNIVRAEAKRRTVLAEAFTAAQGGMISIAQLNTLLTASKGEQAYDAERYPQDVAAMDNAFARTIAAGAQIEYSTDMLGTTILQVPSSVDPALNVAVSKMQMRFREEWRDWSRANSDLRERDLPAYERARTAWISDRSRVYTALANAIGKSSGAENRKKSGDAPGNDGKSQPGYRLFNLDVLDTWIDGIPPYESKDEKARTSWFESLNATVEPTVEVRTERN